jgi:oxygen-independent coproporphyrinogen-3 oxidase
MEAGTAPMHELVSLDDRILFTDAVVFGLRMNAGINLAQLQSQFPAAGDLQALFAKLEQFQVQGLLKRQGEHCWLSHRGQLLADAIGSECLEAMEGNF